MKPTLAVMGFVLCFIAGALAMWGTGGSGSSAKIVNPAFWDDSASSVPTTSDDPIWGSRSAPVTIVLFSDYQCPHCKNLEPTIDALKKTYGPQKLRIIFKHAPIVHAKARVGHEASARVYYAAGSDAFWSFHRRAFENGQALTPENFESWARDAGVDLAKFNDPAIAQRASEKVTADLALARSLGIRGTPNALVNGVPVKGNQPIDVFRTIIDQELEAAQALISAGTPADQVYIKRSLHNRPKVETASTAPVATTTASAEPAKIEEPEKPKDRGKVQEDDATVYQVGLGKAPSKGPADALVTIVQFGNFECRYSSQVEPTVEDVLAQYKDKVRLVWRHRPLPYLRRGIPASLVAEIARAEKGDAGFWAAHKALFDAEKTGHAEKSKDVFSEAGLLSIAKGLGLDEAKVKPVITDADPSTPRFDPPPAAKPYMAAIEADTDAADDLEAEATPHFYINGRRLVGAQSMEKFQKIIDEELAKADALVQAGTAKDGVYHEIMRTAKEPDLPPSRAIEAAPPGAPWLGAENAKVEFHIFSDFECPFCKQATTTIGVVKDLYKDNVKFVWRDRPLEQHATGKLAAVAAREALAQKGSPGFWAFHDELFKVAKTPDFSRDGFEGIAQKQGLDMTAFKDALDKSKYAAEVDKDIAAANAAGITVTPGFVATYAKKGDKLEGFFVSGALTPSKYRRIVKLATAVAEGKKPAPPLSEIPAPKEAPKDDDD
ncbi:MAG: thioredoxin domain-containing protein [Polyangiaceae bacterium]|nr:thioredoxin domain-containing protein [Polyangiaceae bacterium]